MYNPAYLVLSEYHVYHFRWPIPLHFLPDAKRRYVKLSLGTRQSKAALYLAQILAYRANSIIQQDWVKGMPHQQIKAIVQEYCQRFLDEKKRRILEGDVLPPAEIARLQATIDDTSFLSDLANDGVSLYSDGLTKLINTMQIDIAENTPEYERLRKAYVKAMQAVCAEIIRFNHEQDNFDFTPTAIPPSIPSRRKNPAGGTLKLGAMVSKFVAVHVADKAWNESTRENRQAILNMLLEIKGGDYPILDIGQDEAREIRDTVKQLPANRHKNPLVKNLSLMDAIKSNASKMSATTVKQYLNCYGAFFSWCVAEGYLTTNPFTNIKASVDKKDKDKIVRKPFNAHQVLHLQKAISTTKTEGKHYQYWGALLGMYTGARVNEIAQLKVEDIKESAGIWYFHINNDAEDKKLKTAASRRRVPIHTVLLQAGIIDEVKRLRKQKHERFLYELTYCKKNGYGKKLSHYFNEILLVQLGIKKRDDKKTKAYVFHSFRHTVNTCLYQADVSQPIIEMLIGHERTGTSQRNYNAEGYTLQQLKAAMDKYDPANIVINSD